MEYYTYAYLREDGTPYYIGKGKGDRAYRKDGRPCATPKDKNKIIHLKTNLTEEEAFNHEKYMIFILGRKDLGTGILYNKTDGGEGKSGCYPSEETKRKISETKTGVKSTQKTLFFIFLIHLKNKRNLRKVQKIEKFFCAVV